MPALAGTSLLQTYHAGVVILDLSSSKRSVGEPLFLVYSFGTETIISRFKKRTLRRVPRGSFFMRRTGEIRNGER